jgi:hypothetical protein
MMYILYTPSLFDHLPIEDEVDFLKCTLEYPEIDIELYSEILYWINKIDKKHYQFVSLKKNKTGWNSNMFVVPITESENVIKKYKYITKEALSRYDQLENRLYE